MIVATVPVNAGAAATGGGVVVVGASVVVEAGGRVVDVADAVVACGARKAVLDDARRTVLSVPELLHALVTTSSNTANAPARR